MMGRQNEMEQEIEFQPFNGTPSSRMMNNTTLTRTFYSPTSGIVCACVIVLLLFSNCVLLGKVVSGIQGTNSELQVQKQILQNLHLGNGTSFYYTPPSPSPPSDAPTRPHHSSDTVFVSLIQRHRHPPPVLVYRASHNYRKFITSPILVIVRSYFQQCIHYFSTVLNRKWLVFSVVG